MSLTEIHEGATLMTVLYCTCGKCIDAWRDGCDDIRRDGTCSDCAIIHKDDTVVKELIIERPNGSCLCCTPVKDNDPPLLIGTLYVVEGVLRPRAARDIHSNRSIVTPEAEWQGDMAFRIEG